MNAASRLSHIPHVSRRAALLAALVAALAQPAWAQNTNSGGHVEQDSNLDYIYVGDAPNGSNVIMASEWDEDGGHPVPLTHVFGGRGGIHAVGQWVRNNSVVVDRDKFPGMSFQLPGNLYGGSTNPGHAVENKVFMNGGLVGGSVYGNHTEEGSAQGDGTTENVTLKGTAVVVDNAYGGWIGGSSDLVSENLVRLEGGAEVGSSSPPGANDDGGNVYGGYSANQYKAATADAATNNTVVLAENAQVFSSNSLPQQNGHVFGGYAVTGSVAHNKVRIEGGGTPGTGGVWVEGSVTANHAADGSATGSNDLDQPDVSIEAGGIRGNVIGGASDASDGNVTGHVVKIAGGEVFGNIYGGKGNGGSIQDNTIVLAGGKVSGNIYSGFGNGGNIQDNTIVLAGEANLDNSTLYGHDGGGTGMQNTLRVEIKGEQVQAVQNFDTWHFVLPDDLDGDSDPTQADIMLKATNQGGTLAIDGDSVTVSTDGGNLALLGPGERAVLLSLGHGTIDYTAPSTTTPPTAWLDGESAGLPALVYYLDAHIANQLDISLEEKYLYGSGGTNTPGQREQGNTLTLTGGEATAAFGGRALNGDVRGNTLIIDGAATLTPLGTSHPSYDLSGNAYGGYADAGNATGNTVTLSSNMSGQTAGFALYGGFSGNGGEATSGNTLQVQGSEVSVQSINNFETLSFTLGATTGGAMLTINGGDPTVFSTMLNVGADVAAGAPLLSVGEQFVLLHNPDGLLNGGGGALVQGRDYQKLNSASGYDFELSNTDTSIIATITKVQPQPPQPQPYFYIDDSSPTLGELGLLLSGMALAGAAVPVLRRREKRDKKTDTRL